MSNLPEYEFDTAIYKEYLRPKLKGLFEKPEGKKTLIIDQNVRTLINLSIEISALKEVGVTQIISLDVDILEKEVNQVFFFISSKVDLVKKVVKIIKDNEGFGIQRTYIIVFWPQRTILCKQILEDEKVIGSVELKDFSFDLIPLDQDVLSLEMPDSFREITVENDLSVYNYVQESISRIELVMGNIPNIYVKGDAAKMVYDLIKLEQSQRDDPNQKDGDIESLFLFDRSIDLITPMLTQLTYEGLIDEFFQINGNFITIDKEITQIAQNEFQMNSEKDPLIYQARNLLLAPLGIFLRDKVDEQEKQKIEYNKEKQNKVNEKMFAKVKQISAEQKSVQLHVNISTKITANFKTVSFFTKLNMEQGMINGEKSERTLDYVEAMIQVQEDLSKVTRLLCLRSLIDGGINPKTFDYFRREIIQVYGFRIIDFIQNLLKSGLLTRNEKQKPIWPKIQESLNLLNVDIRSDDPSPKDPAYTYSGHCPLTARLVQHIFANKGTWKNIKSSMAIIPGAQIEPEKIIKNPATSADVKRPIVVIYLIGGVTYGEISAFRLLGKLFNKEIIVCSTNITNGTKLVQSLRERI